MSATVALNVSQAVHRWCCQLGTADCGLTTSTVHRLRSMPSSNMQTACVCMQSGYRHVLT
jgi:hypothetical protein